MSGALKLRTSVSPDVWTVVGGAPKDAIHVGPEPPADPDVELWWDSDAPAAYLPDPDAYIFASDAETIEGEVTDKAVTPAGLSAALEVALDATLVEATAPTVAGLQRTQAARWSLATDTLAALTSSGLTTTANYICATVAGTAGNAIMPIWNPIGHELRISYKIKVTKSIVSSKSYVGFTVSTPGVLPSVGNFTFGPGYLQGTGICIVRDNVGGGTAIGLADAALVDGTEYTIHAQVSEALPISATNPSSTLNYRIVDGTGAQVGITQGTTFTRANFPVNNMLIRTTVAAPGAISEVFVAQHPVGPVNGETRFAPPYSSDSVFIRAPATSNGLAVIACHGHGGGGVQTGETAPELQATWKLLTDNGFTVAVPTMHGDKWGNNVAQTDLEDLQRLLVSTFDLNPAVYLWGYSMGGGAVLTAISQRRYPIRAAYVAASACNLAALAATGSFPTIATAYPTTAERNANDPILQPAASYAGTPILFNATTGDTVVNKAANTDAMRTMLGSAATHYLYTATGDHADFSHFRANDVINFFRANT